MYLIYLKTHGKKRHSKIQRKRLQGGIASCTVRHRKKNTFWQKSTPPKKLAIRRIRLCTSASLTGWISKWKTVFQATELQVGDRKKTTHYAKMQKYQSLAAKICCRYLIFKLNSTLAGNNNPVLLPRWLTAACQSNRTVRGLPHRDTNPHLGGAPQPASQTAPYEGYLTGMGIHT